MIVTCRNSRQRRDARRAIQQQHRLTDMEAHNTQQRKDARAAKSALKAQTPMDQLSASVRRIAEQMMKQKA